MTGAMSRIEVLAFDPGQTTGWCYMAMPKGLLRLTGVEDLDDWVYGEIDCLDENSGAMSMLELVGQYPNAALIVENFIADHRMDKAKHTLSPVRMTAAFSYALWRDFPGKRFSYQSASQAKTTCTDDRLKLWELYDRFSGPHARDATRHAFLYLRVQRGKEREKGGALD